MKLTRKTFEELMEAEHNWGHGTEAGEMGEMWDDGARAAIELIFECLEQKNPESYAQEKTRQIRTGELREIV